MKKLKKYLYLFSFLFLFFIPKAHARIIIPALPIDDDLPHIISYWGGNSGVNRLYITYCKNVGDKLYTRDSVPSYSYSTAIGYCYDSNGGYQGYAYRRSVYAELTQEQINNYDFEVSGEWGSESYGSSYNTPLNFNPNISKIATWKDYGNYLVEGQTGIYDTVVITGNTNIYELNTDTILLSEQDYDESLNPDSPSYCPNAGRKLLGQVVNAQSLFFDISGTVSPSNDYLVDGYIDLYSDSWQESSIGSFDDIDLTFTLLEDSDITDLSLLTTNHSFEWITSNNEHVALRINYSIESNVSGGFDSFVHLSMNFIVNNYSLQNLRYPILVYSDTGICNNTIVGYGYKDSRTGLTNSTNPILENYINNFSLPDLDFFNRLNSVLPPGPVDSILTLPLSILNSLSSNLGSSCTPLILTLPFVNSDITLPCMNSFYSSIGLSNFMSWLGIVVSVIMLINYFVYLYNWVESIIMLSHKKFKVWGTGEV